MTEPIIAHDDFVSEQLDGFLMAHLDEEDLVTYPQGMTDKRDHIRRRRVETHLRRCLLCRERHRFLVELLQNAEAAEAMDPATLSPLHATIAHQVYHPEPSPSVGVRLARLAERPWHIVTTALSPLTTSAGQGASCTFTVEVCNRDREVRWRTPTTTRRAGNRASRAGTAPYADAPPAGEAPSWSFTQHHENHATLRFTLPWTTRPDHLLEFACVAEGSSREVLLHGFIVSPSEVRGDRYRRDRYRGEEARGSLLSMPTADAIRLQLPFHVALYPLPFTEFTDADVPLLRWSAMRCASTGSTWSPALYEAMRDAMRREIGEQRPALRTWCEGMLSGQR